MPFALVLDASICAWRARVFNRISIEDTVPVFPNCIRVETSLQNLHLVLPQRSQPNIG